MIRALFVFVLFMSYAKAEDINLDEMVNKIFAEPRYSMGNITIGSLYNLMKTKGIKENKASNDDVQFAHKFDDRMSIWTFIKNEDGYDAVHKETMFIKDDVYLLEISMICESSTDYCSTLESQLKAKLKDYYLKFK